MSEIYRFAGLELDTSRFQIRRAGKALKQQGLLLTLRNRGFRYVGLVETELPGTRQIASAVTASTQHVNPPTSIAVLPFETVGEISDRA